MLNENTLNEYKLIGGKKKRQSNGENFLETSSMHVLMFWCSAPGILLCVCGCPQAYFITHRCKPCPQGSHRGESLTLMATSVLKREEQSSFSVSRKPTERLSAPSGPDLQSELWKPSIRGAKQNWLAHYFLLTSSGSSHASGSSFQSIWIADGCVEMQDKIEQENKDLLSHTVIDLLHS